MAFLDLSTAFDSIDHSMLLSRLHSMFGVSGDVFYWFASYLTGRTQSIKIGSVMSKERVLKCCVPQGSVWGPLLYCDYTIPLGTIIRNFLISLHMYADDSQLYKSISPDIDEDQLTAVLQLQNCISEIGDWMNRNKLKINEDKTEFLIA